MNDEPRRDRGLCLALLLILAIFYVALQNGRWAPVSDADFYLAVARNLATGKGFLFNGGPVMISPPGWPLVLAGAMLVSPSFWLLNLMQMAMFLGAVGIFYRVLRRLASPEQAFGVCLLTGLLSSWFRLTYVLDSEGLFCLLTSATLLVAMQIKEGRSIIWRLALLLGLTAASVAVRWTGILNGLLAAAILVSGDFRPRWNRAGISAALAVGLAVGVFFVLREALDEGWFCPSAAQDKGAVTNWNKIYPLGVRGGLWQAVRNAPQFGAWVTGLLWEPTQLGRGLVAVKVATSLLGWGLVGVLTLGLAAAWRQRQWLLPAVLVYGLFLAVIWPNVNPRYLMPVTPLVLLAIWKGLERLCAVRQSEAWAKGVRALAIALVVAIAACNLPIYAVDVGMIHSRDFYGSYYAGQAKPLIDIADYLKRLNVEDGEVASNNDATNLNVERNNSFGKRGLNFLLDRTVLTVPEPVCDGPPNEALVAWARKAGVKFYVYRPPLVPWRLWHFRTPWLQEKLTGEPPGPPNPFFELYELSSGQAVRVDVPESENRLDRVPGL